MVTFFQQPDWGAPPMRGSWPYAWDDLGFHPDHQATGALAFEALNGPASWTTLSNPALSALPKLSGIPVYEFALTSPTLDLFLELDDDAVATKTAALQAHASQYGAYPDLPANVMWVAQQVAAAAGGGVAMAEGYRSFK